MSGEIMSYMKFGNIPPDLFISGSITVAHGGTPSIAEMLCAPFASPTQNGNLAIIYGGVNITFPNARLLDVQYDVQGPGFQTMILKIADRRWKWKFGWIQGRYNIPDPKGGKIPQRQKTPKELIKLLMDAMGEPQYVAQGVPDKVRPFVEWDEPPVEALLKLCDVLGMRLMLDHLSNKAKIVPLNQGAQIPNLPTAIQGSLDLSQPGVPDKFIFLGGPIEWQWDLILEPVAEEKDGSIVPLDKVSYKPTNGWDHDAPPNHPNVKVEFRELAKKSVWRMYRPVMPLLKGKLKKGVDKIEELDRILLHDHMIETRKVDGRDEEERLPAAIYGLFDAKNDVSKVQPKTLDSVNGRFAEYQRGFHIDEDRGLVIFSDPVFLRVGASGLPVTNPVSIGNKIVKAKLWLRTAISVRDKDTGSFYRSFYEFAPPGQKLGTKPFYVSREDISATYYLDIASRQWKDNETDFTDAAKHYLEQALREFQISDPGSAIFAGIVPVAVDGAIHQVTYSIDQSGYSTTSVQRSREDTFRSITFKERSGQIALAKILRDEKKGPKKPKPKSGKKDDGK